MSIMPNSKHSLFQLIRNVDIENFVLTLKFLYLQHGYTKRQLSEYTGIPYRTLLRFMEDGFAYCDDEKTEVAIQRLKDHILK